MFAAAGKIQGINRAPVWPANDPYIASVTFLMHGEGANNGTVFTDFKGHAATRVGNTVTSTTQAKYGTTSLSFDGSSALSFGASADLAIGSGDYTMECWVYQTARPSGCSIICASASGGSSGIIMQISSAGLLTGSTAAAGLGGGGSISLNAWHHLAFSRNSGTLRMFIDGVQAFSVADATNYTDNILHIGQFSGASQRLTGFMDEIRITKGVGRYPAAFTPPLGAFQEV